MDWIIEHMGKTKVHQQKTRMPGLYSDHLTYYGAKQVAYKRPKKYLKVKYYKKNILAIGNMPPGKGYKKKPYRRKKYKRKTYKKRVPRVLVTKPPNSQLVKLHSTNSVRFDAGINDAVSFIQINLNNPINPFTDGVTATQIGSERHPKYWDHYAGIYDKFEVISTKVSVVWMHPLHVGPIATFLVPSSVEAIAETTTQMTAVDTFWVDLMEANRRAKVHFSTSSTEQTGMNTLIGAWNIKTLEGVKKGAGTNIEIFQGTTVASGSETAPTRAPVCFTGLGSISTLNVDLANSWAMIKIEYAILFTALTSDRTGAAVA